MSFALTLLVSLGINLAILTKNSYLRTRTTGLLVHNKTLLPKDRALGSRLTGIYVGVAQFILSSKRYQLHKVIITFGCRGPNDAEINRTGSVLPDRWCRDASAGRQSKCNGPDIIYRLRRGGGGRWGVARFGYETSLKYLIPPQAMVIFSCTPHMDTKISCTTPSPTTWLLSTLIISLVIVCPFLPCLYTPFIHFSCTNF